MLTYTQGGFTQQPAPTSSWLTQLTGLFQGIGATVASTYQALNQPKGQNVAPVSVPAQSASGINTQTVLLGLGVLMLGGGIAWWAFAKK